MAEETINLKPGAKTAEGVYAGLTHDGKYQIYTLPKDLRAGRIFRRRTMTFNQAAKRTEQLNTRSAYHHNDWQIGDMWVMSAVKENQNEGLLKGTFNKTAASLLGFPDTYWTSSNYVRLYWSSVLTRAKWHLPPEDGKNCVYTVNFSHDYDQLAHYDAKDSTNLSCRPVRLVPVKAQSLKG